MTRINLLAERSCPQAYKYRRPPTTCRASLKSRSSRKALGAHSGRREWRQIDCYDLHNVVVPYTQAWAWQQAAVARLLSAEEDRPSGCVALLQHEPVLTLGAGSTETNLHFDIASPPLPLHRTERGGEATYHGPGQLVLYPILDLQQLQPDLHWYLRSLEEVVIRALDTASGIKAERIPGLTGVWVDGAKIAAVGVRARRWVTYHGLALNVTVGLEPYDHIVPCGIADRPVTNVARLLQDQKPEQKLLEAHARALLDAFETVFEVRLVAATREPDIARFLNTTS